MIFHLIKLFLIEILIIKFWIMLEIFYTNQCISVKVHKCVICKKCFYLSICLSVYLLVEGSDVRIMAIEVMKCWKPTILYWVHFLPSSDYIYIGFDILFLFIWQVFHLQHVCPCPFQIPKVRNTVCFIFIFHVSTL